MNKIYISAPILGYNIEERKTYFETIAKKIADQGFIPVNPLENYNKTLTREEHLRIDTRMLVDCDEIWVHGEFYKSVGCMYEIEVARHCGIKTEFK